MNSQKQKVILVTVTYNSSNYLEKLIKAVSSQSYKIEKAIIVDNNSSKEHFTKIQRLCDEFPLFEIIRSDVNLGGAGGFQIGMEYACKHYSECDWVWIMDDDAFPEYYCLENLLKYKDIEEVGCLAPVIYGTELHKYQLYHHKIVSKYLNKDITAVQSIDDFDDLKCIDANAFVGPLFKMDIVKKIGVPDGSLFIYGDDLEYVFRTSKAAKVFLVKSAIIYHRDTISKPDEVNPNNFWKEYYKYRNRFLFIDKYKTNGLYGLIGKVLLTKSVFKEMWFTLTKKKFGGYRKIKIECEIKAITHGMRGISGKSIDPQQFRERISKMR